jgi:outer membrane protein assembly factor BamB
MGEVLFPDESPTGDSKVAVANGVVYYQTDRRLHALSGATGSARRRWSAPVSGVKNAAPTVANGVVYAGRQAFDAATGRGVYGGRKVGALRPS